MPNQTGIARLTQRYINEVNDPVIGQTVSDGQEYAGQLGAVLNLSAAEALKLSKTSVGTLYAGRYQYVRFLAAQVGTTKKGGPVYWSDPDNYVVDADAALSGLGFAGVALNVVTKGNYGWILTRGKCECQPLDNTTKGTPAIGDVMVCGTIGRFDDIVDPYASELTSSKVAGQWIAAPADATDTRYAAYVTKAVLID